MNNKTLFKIILIFLIATVLFYLTKTVYDCVKLAKCFECSAPWYTALLLDTCVFIVPLSVESFILFHLNKKIKKSIH